MRHSFALALVVLLSPSGSYAETPESRAFPEVRERIEQLHKEEQAAFVEGDCAKVTSFFDEDVTFYANGRRVPSLQFLRGFCEQIPRPFERVGDITDEIKVLSETTAYILRTIDFEPEAMGSKSHRREVVTQVWCRGPSGWKIVHFHSSVSTVRNR